MALAYDVIVIGDYYLDLIFSGLPKFPELGTEIIGTGFEMIPGGAFNSAVAMHRLGLKVGWAADFGSDDFSRFAIERAKAEGLSDALFVVHERPLRRITVAVSYPEERAFITYNDPSPETPAVLKALATISARVLYVPGYCHEAWFPDLAQAVCDQDTKLIMDGNAVENFRLEMPGVRESLQCLEVFMPNASEAMRVTGEDNLEQAMCLLADVCPLVVVKDGSHGAYACNEGHIIHVSAIPIEPLDTTGAGDCFNAGFVRAWLAGASIEQCLRWGNIVGGLSTLAHGGTGRVITPADVEEYLKSCY